MDKIPKILTAKKDMVTWIPCPTGANEFPLVKDSNGNIIMWNDINSRLISIGTKVEVCNEKKKSEKIKEIIKDCFTSRTQSFDSFELFRNLAEHFWGSAKRKFNAINYVGDEFGHIVKSKIPKGSKYFYFPDSNYIFSTELEFLEIVD